MEPTNANDPPRTTNRTLAEHAPPVPTVTHAPVGDVGPDPQAAVRARLTAAPPPADTPPEIPGYIIEGVLGRGGLGVVYQARHLALKRTVALKMILAGGHADEQDLLRFRAEVETVARLQHPGIVQIYEVGALGGHPFCALEFVEGGSLAQKLGGQPLPIREAVRLVETLARAMHLAHSRNVIHRDLKPANVLLTKEGTPKITDFGFARQLDGDSAMTLAGTVMGTPSYMAPEQASGQAHTAGPAADVYALGAILYECLTGRPPFQGKTLLETLEQVRWQEPVPPRRLQAQVPRDLETVCLRCLRKEPEQRYGSAAELADELGRCQRGEPVLARPVGRLERVWRWCRRKPALAVALVMAVVFLVGGAAGVFWFGAEANTQANQARQREAEAVAARKREQQANHALAQKITELELSQDHLEETFARSWLSPLLQQAGPLTEPEMMALQQVAAQRGQRLALRFVREGLNDSASMLGFEARAVYAWHAALGLDSKQRAEAERHLLAALHAAARDTRQRQDLACAAASLGDLAPSTVAALTALLLEAMGNTTDSTRLQKLAKGLSAVTARLQPRETSAVAIVLTQLITKTTNPEVRSSLAGNLSAMASGLEPKAATTVATMLTQTISKTADLNVRLSLAGTLAAVASQMPPQEAAVVCAPVAAMILQEMTKTNDPKVLSPLAASLSVVAARLEPKETAALHGAAAATLTQIMTKTAEPYVRLSLATTLSAVVTRMEPKEAARVCAPVAAMLTQTIIQTIDGHVQSYLTSSLLKLTAYLEPKDAAVIAVTLTQAVTKTSDRYTLLGLVPSLSAVAARLEPKEAARICAPAVETLTQAILQTANGHVRSSLATKLSELAVRMEPKQAAALCGPVAAGLAQEMAKTSDPAVRLSLAPGLLAVAARLQPKEAGAVCGTVAVRFAQELTETSDPHALTAALSMLAAHLNAKEAAVVATTLTQNLTKTTAPNAQSSLASALPAVVARLEAKEAAAVCGRAAATLIQALDKAADPNLRSSLAYHLYKLAAYLEPEQAAPLAVTLTQTLTKLTDLDTLRALTPSLSVLTARLESKKAAAVCDPLAVALTQALSKTTDPNQRLSLASSLALLAVRLEPKKAATVAVALTQTLTLTTDLYWLQSLTHNLLALAVRLEPKDADAVCGQVASTLTQAMSKSTDPNARSSLPRSLSAVLARGGTVPAKQRFVSVASTIGGLSSPAPPFTSPALLKPALEPLPVLLSAQMLVDLLKEPLCVGEARRLVLEQLTRHYGRPFADQWDFVRFAEERHLRLDLRGPPPRLAVQAFGKKMKSLP